MSRETTIQELSKRIAMLKKQMNNGYPPLTCKSYNIDKARDYFDLEHDLLMLLGAIGGESTMAIVDEFLQLEAF